jgi:hypothetical protein
MCLVTTERSRPNSSAICCWVSQTVSAHAAVGRLEDKDFAAGCLHHHRVLPVSLAAAMRRRSLQESSNNDSGDRRAMATCP